MKALLFMSFLSLLTLLTAGQQCALCRETVAPLEYELIQYIENTSVTGPELSQAVSTWLQENVCSIMNFTSEQCNDVISYINTLVTAYEQNGISSLDVTTRICEHFKMCEPQL